MGGKSCEEGRGFAVVANEVRKLAEQVIRSMSGISALIHAIQAETSGIIKPQKQAINK